IALPASALAAGATVDFARDVQPIFKSACYQCHGPQKQKGKLRLDAKTLALHGGKSGKAIVPGHGDQSELLRRITSKDEDERMPQDREPLTGEQIAVIRAWIEQGANWPDEASAADAKIEKHWALVPPKRVDPPSVANRDWVRNDVDRFILARLEKEHITASPEATKVQLLRRVSLDLIGLPPTPAELESFINDPSPDAFEKQVERLLASPHYGERWARHWLDLARYAESEGFKADETRPNAWRYRDYVINAFNSDKPYDRFIKEQIAGDELWPNDPEARVATGFNRHYPDESNARNLLQRRQEILNDITDTTAAVFLGMTFACARCHNHKYDEISQADYYRLQAFFANVRADDRIPVLPPQKLKEYQAKLAVWEEKTKSIREEMDKLEEPKRKALLKDYFDKYPREVQVALTKKPQERTPLEWHFYHKAMLYMDPASHQFLADADNAAKALKGDAKKRYDELKVELDQFKDLYPGELPVGTGLVDVGRECPPTYILRKGVYDAPTQEVQPAFPSALAGDARPSIKPLENSSGRRTALAEWLSSPSNPQTARVMVNRIWHYHFGKGIVGTPSDFGVQGDRPTHPELLDYLATEFVRNGWSNKAMHRLIVNSATYRQSAGYDPIAAKIDPEDRLLWRYPRHRLEGEVIRDSALAVAGLLNTKMGGPSIFPEVPTGMESRGGWHVNGDAGERNRRSVYVFVRRNTRYPMFEAFDMPDTHESCGRRYNTITPIQALSLLNDKQTMDWAKAFAGKVMAEAGNDEQKQIEMAYQLALDRKPTQSEAQAVMDFFARHEPIIEERLAKKQPVAVPAKMPEGMNKAHGAAVVDFCHMLINANEFVYTN
ncbi:MAG TPA: PSD1 and planctomycete cytochrome C domain-containing protein, partial [Tepidisphaeraceae bacterium]|nr:PSD1 and planctomycete cytochrome C domain-containing protein [Tepidisphaeraceae bacterium]